MSIFAKSFFTFSNLKLAAVYGLFSKFGAIESIKSGYCRNRFQIEFKDEKIAVQLLKKDQLKFNGSTFQLRTITESSSPMPSDYFQSDQLLQQIPAEDSPKHILNLLNDYCLIEIFQNFDQFLAIKHVHYDSKSTNQKRLDLK